MPPLSIPAVSIARYANALVKNVKNVIQKFQVSEPYDFADFSTWNLQYSSKTIRLTYNMI